MVGMELVRAFALLLLLLMPASALAQGATSGAPGMFCPSIAKISQTASAQVITGVALQKVYICGIVLGNAGTAQAVNIVEGTGTTCATGIAGLLGGTTAATGLNLAINATFSAVSGTPWLKSATVANNICVLQSGATQLSGVITYRQAP